MTPKEIILNCILENAGVNKSEIENITGLGKWVVKRSIQSLLCDSILIMTKISRNEFRYHVIDEILNNGIIVDEYKRAIRSAIAFEKFKVDIKQALKDIPGKSTLFYAELLGLRVQLTRKRLKIIEKEGVVISHSFKLGLTGKSMAFWWLKENEPEDFEHYKKQESVVKDKTEYLANLEKAQAFIQNVAKKTQEQLKYHIEDIVQLALDSIFPHEYRFSIDFEVKYGKTSCNLIFKNNGYEIDIMKAAGGGVVDIASLALRVAIWSIGKTDNVLVLDEPIKNIQPASLQMEAWDIIQKLSQQLNLQFIIITNSTNNGEALEYNDTTKVFTVVKENEFIGNNSFGISKIKEG